MSISGNTSFCNKETMIQKLKYSLEHNILKMENKLYTTKIQEDLKNIERVIKKFIPLPYKLLMEHLSASKSQSTVDIASERKLQ